MIITLNLPNPTIWVAKRPPYHTIGDVARSESHPSHNIPNFSYTQIMAIGSDTNGEEMKSTQIPLTLIVAATSKGGIGKNGTLPWSLKAEMKYFARVTTRVPPSPPRAPGTNKASGGSGKNDTQEASDEISSTTQRRNAVIMGRKTWESIPAKFRPLKGRVNVVLSRSGSVQGLDASTTTSTSSGRHEVKGETVIVCKSLGEGLADLVQAVGWEGLGRAYVIGGGSVYAEALRMEQARHVLLTRVGGGFECDTFFPVDLEGEDGQAEGWRRESTEGLAEFTGEDFGSDGGGVRQREGDVEFEYCLYSR